LRRSGGFSIDQQRLRELLEGVADGTIAVPDAVDSLRDLPYEDIGFAKIDHHRALRDALPEAVLAEGKTPGQTAAITARIAEHSGRVLVTRADAATFEAVRGVVPDAAYHERARCVVIDRRQELKQPGVTVLCAGTADLPVAEEAAVTAEVTGSAVERVYDVGVAGIHRLLDHLPALRDARAIVVVAGMEGALPSVVGGLVSVPVIAVPTSIGYGASFGGLAPLLTMLNSCAAGVSVVNIDNGFGAGYLAAVINRLALSERPD
jgi:NCAIR mutase (PurE)-related protein